MIGIGKQADAFASWPTRERLRILKRILPRARVEDALAHTGHDRAHCPRLPGRFKVRFVVTLGPFCRDRYRQVFRWLQPYRRGGVPPRSTSCEARQRPGVAPMRHLAETTVVSLGTPETPGAFYRGMRLMGHYLIRVLMQEAAARRGIDPQRLSFTGTLKILRCRLPGCPDSVRGLTRWYKSSLSEIAEEVLPARRDRVNPQVIKREMSDRAKKRPENRNYPQPTK